jgi:hypothetical protein
MLLEVDVDRRTPRRGAALRWSDIVDGRVTIGRRSRGEGRAQFKPLKGHEDTEGVRVVKIPEETLAKLKHHRCARTNSGGSTGRITAPTST